MEKNNPAVLSLESRLSFIRGLELADLPEVVLKADDQPSAHIVSGSTVSFVSNLSEENRQDVLNSTLIAQLAASKKFDRETQTNDWYKFYREVLENSGWTTQEFNFDQVSASGATFSVDKIILELLAAIATQEEIVIVEKTIESLKALDNGNAKLVLFEKQSHSLQKGNFQIALASEAGKVVEMKIGAFYFSTTDTVTNLLWFTFSGSTASFFRGSQTMVLNKEVYSQVRKAILEALGNNAKRFIASLDI